MKLYDWKHEYSGAQVHAWGVTRTIIGEVGNEVLTSAGIPIRYTSYLIEVIRVRTRIERRYLS